MIKLIILGITLAWAVWLWGSLERRSLYFPDQNLGATPRQLGMPYEDVTLVTKDNVHLHGWFIPGSQRKVLLLSHGNAGNISHRLGKALLLREVGSSLFLYDYRGYGQSEGRPSEAGTYADAEAAYAYLTETRGIHPKNIIFYGESLGCAVAIEMARRYPSAGGLILESPFTSTVDMGKRMFPGLPVEYIVRYRYDNLRKIPAIQMPILLMHSPDDEIVPFHMGRALYREARAPKMFLELSGSHNDGYERSSQIYKRTIESFLKD